MASFHWDLNLKTPRQGDRPFEIAHIDHTELDVECIAGAGHPLGRPWMTLLTDAFSRRTLAFYLTFDPPSYRSCMMILRECIRRFGRFPQILVVDGGREFESTYFETLLARYECTKKTRPPLNRGSAPLVRGYLELLFCRTKSPFCGDPRYVAFVQTMQRWKSLRELERHIPDRGSKTP